MTNNIDRLYLEKNKAKYSGCWKLPDILDIKYSNEHWQVMELPRATVFLYAAYLDTREVFIKTSKSFCDDKLVLVIKTDSGELI